MTSYFYGLIEWFYPVNAEKKSDDAKTENENTIEKVAPAAGRNNPYVQYTKIPVNMVAVSQKELSQVIANLRHVDVKRELVMHTAPLIEDLHKFFNKNNIVY